MALSGMTFACTGKTALKREDLTKKIKDNGGAFATTLTKKVTHLLCGEGFEETDKYRKAKDNEAVHVVTESFLDACLQNKKKRPKEEDYQVGQESSDEKEEKESNEESNEEQEEQEQEEGEEKEEKEEKEEEEEEEEEEEKEEEAQDTTPATPSQRKKHEPKEAKDHALKGWAVLLGSHLSSTRNEITSYVEKHGGSVTTSAVQATHVLGEATSKAAKSALESKAIVVDEEYMRSLVKEYKEDGGDEAIAASQTPVKPSPLKKKGRGKAKVIERVVSRKVFRGVPHYLVQYVGLNDSHNELLTQEDLVSAGGEKALKTFLQQHKKEMKKLDFSVFMATEVEETLDSPKKAKPSPQKAKKPKSQTGAKSTPKKNNKRKRVAEVEEEEEEEEEKPQSTGKGKKGKGKTTPKGKNVKRTLDLESPQKPKTQKRKSPAKRRRVK